MENTQNENAPEPQKKKELKSFKFTRTLQKEEGTPQGPKEEKEEKENQIVNPEKSENIILNFSLNLFEDEIVFNVEQRKEKFKVANIIYEKTFTSEFFKDYKILNQLTLEKIFDFIHKSRRK